MLRNTFLVLCVLCAAILIGCSKTETGNTNTAAENSNKGTTTTTKTEPTTTSSGDKIGIAECDEYIAKYEACTPKVPEVGRAAYKSGLDQTRASWKKLADNPQTKASLAAACKQALATQASVWKGYGCE
jgi:curli biogenesis system outer membrane secretion channel CsgG